MGKNYGDIFTKGFNENVEDKIPEWMENINTNIKIDKNPFKNIDDPILNPKKQRVGKCNICGAPLKNNQVDICSNCCIKN
jgi:hypothetical protein